ncbi:hypothetical protein A3Q56_06173, partial [Intoshia linei]
MNSETNDKEQDFNTNDNSSANENSVINRLTIKQLLREVDAYEIIDRQSENVLLNISDEFIEKAIEGACRLAKHRKSDALEIKDVEFFL